MFTISVLFIVKAPMAIKGWKWFATWNILPFFLFSSFNINSRKNVALSQWNLIIITTNLWMTAFLDKVRKVKLAQGPPPYFPLSSSQYISPTFHPLSSLPTQTAIHTRCASHVCFPFSLEHFTCLHLYICMLCASKCMCTCYSVNHHIISTYRYHSLTLHVHVIHSLFM